MMTIVLAVIVLVFAAIPGAPLPAANLHEYRPPPAAPAPYDTGVIPARSVLIPAQRGSTQWRCCASGPRQPGRRA